MRCLSLVVAVVSVGVLMTIGGCPDAFDGARSRYGMPVGNGPLMRIEGFDHEALKASLQGDWIVIRDAKRIFEFAIEGERARVVDHRFAIPRSIEGELLLRSATSFGVEEDDGVAYFYSFVKVDDTTYMGQGGAIAWNGQDLFEAHLGAWERLVKTEQGCKVVTEWAGKVSEVDVKCDFHEKNGERLFQYEAVDAFRPDRMKNYTLRVVGDVLLEDELYRSVASRRAGPKSGEGSVPSDEP